MPCSTEEKQMPDKYQKFKKYALLLGMLLFFPLMLMLTARFMSHTFKTLPYFKLTDGLPEAVFSPEAGRQVSFDSLMTHDGIQMNSSDLEGRVYLSFFFSPKSEFVAKITKRLLYATYKYPKEDDIVFVCFNTEPAIADTSDMAAYMRDAKARKDKWYFLTGDSAYLDNLYQDDFMLPDYKEVSHLWLVDAKGYLRGRYNANREQEIERAIEDIALLKREMLLAKQKAE